MIYNLLSNENLFLIVLGFIWILGAVLQDLRRREVDNVWNFSLIFFALAYRASISIYTNDYWFFINGCLGFAIFLILGNFVRAVWGMVLVIYGIQLFDWLL